jgi:hypothetical protein
MQSTVFQTVIMHVHSTGTGVSITVPIVHHV